MVGPAPTLAERGLATPQGLKEVGLKPGRNTDSTSKYEAVQELPYQSNIRGLGRDDWQLCCCFQLMLVWIGFCLCKFMCQLLAISITSFTKSHGLWI